jgi:hypothetical protein
LFDDGMNGGVLGTAGNLDGHGVLLSSSGVRGIIGDLRGEFSPSRPRRREQPIIW